MVDHAALRGAIEALEETSGTVGNATADLPLLLGRLYATYAQTVLDQHGVAVDLMGLCGDTRWGGSPRRRGDP